MKDWNGTPKWRQDGRTGPGPLAPKYKSAKDRKTVRKGGTPGMAKNPNPYGGGNSNPGGPGGYRGKIKPTKGGGGKPPKKSGCCSMVAALRSAKDGNWRLARRYIRMTPHFLARRFA